MKNLILLFATVFISFTSVGQNKLDNEFYIRFGYSIPSWEPVERKTDDWAGGYNKYGAMFDLGTIFMLNSLPTAENMAFGLDVDYLSVYWHRYQNDRSALDVHTLRLSSKIGPSFTYSPKNKIAFDVFVKADIGWASGINYIYNKDIEEDDIFTNFGTIGLSTGFNVRIGELMLGFEFNTIRPKLENEENQGEYLGDANDSSTDKSKLPSISFMLGLSF